MGVRQWGMQTHLFPDLDNGIPHPFYHLTQVFLTSPESPPDITKQSLECSTVCLGQDRCGSSTFSQWKQSSLIIFLLWKIQSNIPVVCKCPLVTSEYTQHRKSHLSDARTHHLLSVPITKRKKGKRWESLETRQKEERADVLMEKTWPPSPSLPSRSRSACSTLLFGAARSSALLPWAFLHFKLAP